MSLLRVLASGVDGLEVTARGTVRLDVWELLERAKLEAQDAGEAVPFQFGSIDRRFLILPHGRRGWPYWLTSPDMEMGLGRNRQGVPAYAQLHSAYLHAMGPELAVGLLGTLLRVDVMGGPFQLIGSRVDVYADVQGWEFDLTDMERFASRGRLREAFPVGEQAAVGVFVAGRRVTGFRFGRDAVVARVYDKTAEIRRRALSWLPDLWGERDDEAPVWRVEFQLRRRAIAEFRVTEVDEVLSSVQDFWEHCTREWLTLRTRTASGQRARWPLDPSWAEVQAVAIAPTRTGVIRRRLIEGNEEMTLRGLQGYLTSWAALRGHEELGSTLRALEPRVRKYLGELDRTFGAEVAHKRARLLELTDIKGPQAPARRPLPWSGATPQDRRRGGSGALPRLGDEKDSSLEDGGGGDPAAVGRDDQEVGSGTETGAGAGGRRSKAGRLGKGPGEGSGTHPRGREDDGGQRVDGREGVGAPVGAAPPTLPEGSESNRFVRRRTDGRGGAAQRRWRARDGGGGGGDARQRIGQGRRVSVSGRGRPASRRGHARRPSRSSPGCGGASGS